MLSAYIDLFRSAPGLRRFWLGLVTVDFGNEITKVAFIWLVYEKTHSAAAVGWLMVCLTGPIIVGAFLAGAALDRFDKRRVMMLDACFRGAIIALIPALHVLGRLELWHLYAAADGYQLLLMIPLAGTPALIPSLVPRERLSAAC